MASPATITVATGELLLGAMIDFCLLSIPVLLDTSNSTTYRLRQWDPVFYRGRIDGSLISTAKIVIQAFAAWRTSTRIQAVTGTIFLSLISCTWFAMHKVKTGLWEASPWTDETKRGKLWKLQHMFRSLSVVEKPRTAQVCSTDGPFKQMEGDKTFPRLHKALASWPEQGLPGGSVSAVEQKANNYQSCENGAKSTWGAVTIVAERPTLVSRTIAAPHVGAIKIIELQRPEAKNAISKQMLQELEEQLDQIYEQASTYQVRALIVASSVNDAFCAGADLKERRRMNTEETQKFLDQLRRTFSKLAALPVPTIASVSGLALGGGLELALSCHIRVFSSNAAVGLPETRLAIIPGAGGTFRLRSAVGLSNALDMVLTGRRVRGVEAFRLGLCSRLVEMNESTSGDLEALRSSTLDTSLQLAKEIATGGPVAIRAALSAVNRGSEEAENAAYDVVLATEDRTQALERFGSKQPLEFMGR